MIIDEKSLKCTEINVHDLQHHFNPGYIIIGLLLFKCTLCFYYYY